MSLDQLAQRKSFFLRHPNLHVTQAMMHHMWKSARCSRQLQEKLGSYQQLVRLLVATQQRQYHAEELGMYGYKPSPPTDYQGK